MTLVESSPGRDILDTKWRQSSPHEAPPTTGVLSLYNRGDRRRLYWPCPHCGEYFQPEVANMTGYRDDGPGHSQRSGLSAMPGLQRKSASCDEARAEHEKRLAT
jgi:phage terminase large subunit GpA-like protein